MTRGKRKKSVTIYLTDSQLHLIEDAFSEQSKKDPLLNFQSFLRKSLFDGSQEKEYKKNGHNI